MEEKEYNEVETIKEYVDKFIICQGCKGKAAQDMHTCPYQSDINGDDETLCNCCETCEQNCADDI